MKPWLYPSLVFLAMVAWGVLHSWLAAVSTKRTVRTVFGAGIDRYYRLLFVVVALLTLVPILAMVIFLPSRVLWAIPRPYVFLTRVIQLASVAAILWTVSQTDAQAFLGLRQVREPDAPHETRLVTTGLYGWVRHPLYLFSMTIFWLMPVVTDLTLAFILAGTLYFLVGSIPEERKLEATFGEAYRQYRRDVPRLLPRFKRRSGSER